MSHEYVAHITRLHFFNLSFWYDQKNKNASFLLTVFMVLLKICDKFKKYNYKLSDESCHGIKYNGLKVIV